MKIAVTATELFPVEVETRMPFRYGIATMTRLPHLFVRARVEISGREQLGVAADHLPPKWFTKNPATSFAEDISEMLAVIRHACEAASQLAPAPTVFAFWQALSAAQKSWAEPRGHPPLLWNFGVSLLERAVIDAFCRATGTTFARAVRENTLGLRLGDIYRELADAAPAEFLPADPLRSIVVRHTVGLADPLTDADITPGERVNDGLPESLEAYLREDAITHLKIKLCGDLERDRARLHRIIEVLAAHGGDGVFTLDGNESFERVEPLRRMWETLRADPPIARFLERLLFVEQPLHRDAALTAETAAELLAWEERPPMIIDESDGEIDALAVALASGYAGTSFKSCKGVCKGIANACLIAHRLRIEPARALHFSAEDLCNIGPVALLQDLAVVATLGIPHAERNGHHYFAGLSPFPAELQKPVLRKHGDLYLRHRDGFPTLRIADGRIDIGSVVDAPFGVAAELDFSGCIPATRFHAFRQCDAG